jgi:hypothetical protein
LRRVRSQAEDLEGAVGRGDGLRLTLGCRGRSFGGVFDRMYL